MSEQLQQKAKAPRKKFKLTKQLIKIALDNGHTQIGIQKMCRLSSQSQVSDWKNGGKIAYEPYRVCRRPFFLRECPNDKTKIYS